MLALGARPTVAMDIDGVSAILDLVAEGLGVALLPRHAVARSVRPSAYRVRAVIDPPLRIGLATAISSLRPATLTQQAALALLREEALRYLGQGDAVPGPEGLKDRPPGASRTAGR